MNAHDRDFEMDDMPVHAGRIAYIKPTGVEEAQRLGILPAGIQLPPGLKLYVLHSEDGAVLGYTDGYDSAYGAAGSERVDPRQRPLMGVAEIRL